MLAHGQIEQQLPRLVVNGSGPTIDRQLVGRSIHRKTQLRGDRRPDMRIQACLPVHRQMNRLIGRATRSPLPLKEAPAEHDGLTGLGRCRTRQLGRSFAAKPHDGDVDVPHL